MSQDLAALFQRGRAPAFGCHHKLVQSAEGFVGIVLVNIDWNVVPASSFFFRVIFLFSPVSNAQALQALALRVKSVHLAGRSFSLRSGGADGEPRRSGAQPPRADPGAPSAPKHNQQNFSPPFY